MFNIQAKIEDANTSMEILEKVKSNLKLSQEERIKAQKCMKTLNCELSKPRHVTERTSIYHKKLDAYLSRVEYHKQNFTFEFYRRKFYRDLSGESRTNYSITSTELMSSVPQCGIKDDEGHYDDYLMEYAPDEMEVDSHHSKNLSKFLRTSPIGKRLMLTTSLLRN